MRVFFDCEFTGLHQNTTLISIGLVAENGREFYAECTDYDKSQVNQWIQENVISKLIYSEYSSFICGESKGPDSTEGYWQIKDRVFRDSFLALSVQSAEYIGLVNTTSKVSFALKAWLASLGKPIEMWGDVLSWDWILFANLVADYSEGYPKWPHYIHYIPFDLATLFKIKGLNPDMNRADFAHKRQYENHHHYGATRLEHNALWDAKTIRACYEKLIGLEKNQNG